jgi:hypothetical protein
MFVSGCWPHVMLMQHLQTLQLRSSTSSYLHTCSHASAARLSVSCWARCACMRVAGPHQASVVCHPAFNVLTMLACRIVTVASGTAAPCWQPGMHPVCC